MKSSAIPYGLALVVIIGALITVIAIRRSDGPPDVGSYTEFDPGYGSEPLEEFTLTTSTGGTLNSTDLKGDVWIASFFYTSCPGPCLRMNLALDQLHDTPDLQEVKYVSITCDPPNDTLDVLQKYAERFEADPERWFFCRGEFRYVQKVGEDIMKLSTRYKDHTNYAVLIDRAGKIRGRYSLTDPVQLADMKQNLQLALAEPASADEETPSIANAEGDAKTQASDAAESEPDPAATGA